MISEQAICMFAFSYFRKIIYLSSKVYRLTILKDDMYCIKENIGRFRVNTQAFLYVYNDSNSK